MPCQKHSLKSAHCLFDYIALYRRRKKRRSRFSGCRIARTRYSLFFPLLQSLYPPPAALPSGQSNALPCPLPVPGARVQIFSYANMPQQKARIKRAFYRGAEGEI